MIPHSRAAAFALSALSLAAADQAWKGKPFPEWTEDDAKEVMTDSPWAKTVTPTLVKASEDHSQPYPGSRRRGGFGVGGATIGLPGMGRMGQRGGPQPDQSNRPAPSTGPLPRLILRWESALPMQEAELKAHDAAAPAIDEDYYAIAVYGIPRNDVMDDSKKTAESLRKQAVLKPDGKREVKPSRVEILFREDGPVVVYLFPRSEEITWRDHSIDFNAQVSRLKFAQSFSTDDMMLGGKLEL